MKADDMVLYQAFINTFNTMIKNKNYFMKKWKNGLKNENILVKYKVKQFMRIIENAEAIEEFDSWRVTSFPSSTPEYTKQGRKR